MSLDKIGQEYVYYSLYQKGTGKLGCYRWVCLKQKLIVQIYLPAPNCIKDFHDLSGDSGQSGLTLQLFLIVILANQVWLTIVSNGNNCNVKPDWPE